MSNDHKLKPCGDTQPGPVHFVTTPGSRNFIAWRVSHPSPNANCTLRLGTGADESDYHVLMPVDKSGNEKGVFPCGREESSLDGKEVKFPKNFTCDSCVIQLEWALEGAKGTPIKYHYCGDIQVIDKEAEECAGKCQNGGVCMNGECKCRKGTTGAYC